MPLSERHPALYAASVRWHRTSRWLEWAHEAAPQARFDPALSTPCSLTTHSSVLMRPLSGVDMELQRNKVENLRLAIPHLDGRVLRPGETLSFWRSIGNPRAARGYLPGLVLVGGSFESSVGGGLCQLSNLVYWMALHTPLAVVEQHHHGYDVFPDSGRVLPFGSGATVFYNYVDLVLANRTPFTFRLRLWLTESKLCGAFEADRMPPLAYHVRESDHRFYEEGGRVYRENRLHRVEVDRASGVVAATRLITHNVFPVMYPVPRELLVSRSG